PRSGAFRARLGTAPVAGGPSRGTAEGAGDNELCTGAAVADMLRPAGGHSCHYLRSCGAGSDAAGAPAVWWRRVRLGWPGHGLCELARHFGHFTRAAAAGVEPSPKPGRKDQL